MAWVAFGAVLALFGGLGFGAYRAAQSPAFYATVVAALWDKIGPEILKAIAKDFSPENAAKVAEESREAKDRAPKVGHREH